MDNYFKWFNSKYYSHKDVIASFGVIVLFLDHETENLPDYDENSNRGLTKSPWLIIDDNGSERSQSPKQERFYYYLWNTIFSD